jgi:hypothetical protein
MSATTDTVEVVSKRVEANRLNGRKSKGPTTADGKSRSRMNALKHGLTAKELVLPGEEPDQLQQRVSVFKADFQPQNETEDYLVELAAIASWELQRCQRVIAAKLNERVRYRLLELGEAEADEVEDHARRLFWDPGGPIALYPHSRSLRLTRISSPDSVEDPLNPARIVNRLEHLAGGFRWLLDRWIDLRNLLEDGLKWQAPDRLKAIRLLGRQPMDLLADERVLMIYLACDAMDPTGPTSLDDMRTETNDLELARIKERVQGRGGDWKKPASPGAGKAALLALIDRATSRLECKLSAHRERQEFEKAMQMDLLAFDDSADGELIRRYLSSPRIGNSTGRSTRCSRCGRRRWPSPRATWRSPAEWTATRNRCWRPSRRRWPRSRSPSPGPSRSGGSRPPMPTPVKRSSRPPGPCSQLIQLSPNQ